MVTQGALHLDNGTPLAVLHHEVVITSVAEPPLLHGRPADLRRGRVRRGAASVYQEQTEGMADTTTVKVRTSTRDLLLQIGSSRHQSADQVIVAALAAMRRDERRQTAAAEARAIAHDPVDLAEIRAIQDDIAALREG